MNERPNRRSIRMPAWDYRLPGYYFVTICADGRRNLFIDERIREIAEYAWTFIPNQPHALHVTIDEWVLMPNHHHGILNFTTEFADFGKKGPAKPGPLPGSLGAVIGNYKMLVAKRIKALHRTPNSDFKVWQRGYWERLIRNERELEATREYIRLNPLRWEEDRDNLDALLSKLNFHDGP